ncbi:hypothetical protein TNCV_1942511 [Trichonephila clavipes]|nr:hypothetical protein TNCV_1942511 [Trichonephila clavipes]
MELYSTKEKSAQQISSTICLGDLNAKHPIWDCSAANSRRNELLDIIDDNRFSILNDGLTTHFSYSYNTKETLDISIASPDLGLCCKWTLLENLGSEHFPILNELKKRQLLPTSNNKHWNFMKVDWQSFAEAVDNGIKSIHLKDSVELNWCSFKEMILREAMKYIPRVEGRNIKIRASHIVHGCRRYTHRGTFIFNRDFRVNDLEAAIDDSCLNKSSGPDGTHGQMIDHLGLNGR